MDSLISDPEATRRLIRRRRAQGLDRKDEVWEGVYIMAPPRNNEHQDDEDKIYLALALSIDLAGSGKASTGVGIPDRVEKWAKNFRCPDLSVFLNGTTAINHGMHWLGGPNFVVEVLSLRDRSREKLAFQAKLGVKERLLVDRDRGNSNETGFKRVY